MKMIKKFAKYFLLVVGSYILLCILTPFNKILRNRSIKNQIEYLNQLLHNGYDDELQMRFPEGKLFSNAIFSLSVIEVSDQNENQKQEYAQIIDSAIKRIFSDQTLSPFNSNLKPKYGMFYNGWTNYVLTTYQNSSLFKYSTIKEEVQKHSNIIQNRISQIQSDSIQILDTYSYANWPADNMIGLISVKDDSIQSIWLDKIMTTTIHESGLVHHSGSDYYTIRGSSQAMITFCMAEIEFEKVQSYNQKFKDIFIDEYLGVQLVKENEDGSNQSDIDSGPVIFGYGSSASIMNIKTQASLNKNGARSTWALMNTISIPINIFGTKFYLFKIEPMFDIFMLWACVEL